MKKLTSSCNHVARFILSLTTILTITLWLGSAPTARAQASVSFWSGSAMSISTANCNGAGGLCQPAPACNNGAGPNPDNISASVTLCEVSVSTTIGPPLTLPNPSQKTG